MNQNWRDKCTLDLKAKLAIEKGKPYIKGGNPWLYDMGSGGYWNQMLSEGASVEDLERLTSQPVSFRYGKAV